MGSRISCCSRTNRRSNNYSRSSNNRSNRIASSAPFKEFTAELSSNGSLRSTANIIVNNDFERNNYYEGVVFSSSDLAVLSFFNMIPLKKLVSKKRHRYNNDGFNLDLTYITNNIIAMGYPASKLEGCYRNHIDDVVKMLDKKHMDHYMIYNLCLERSYDISKFHNRVKNFPFEDHNPPKIDLIEPFCKDVHAWLNEHPNNVAVIHCKAGKGRTGTMICCYLLHSKLQPSAQNSLDFYGQARTQDHKGVTIPSQMLYVRYYERMLRERLVYQPVQMYISEIILEPPPNYSTNQSVYFLIHCNNNNNVCGDGGGSGGPTSLNTSSSSTAQTAAAQATKVSTRKPYFKSDSCEIPKSDTVFRYKFNSDQCAVISGDVKVELYSKSSISGKVKWFQFWFNTFFVEKPAAVTSTMTTTATMVTAAAADAQSNNGFLHHRNGTFHSSSSSSSNSNNSTDRPYVLTLQRHELDVINKKDKQNKTFSPNFKVSLMLHKAQNATSNEWLVPDNNKSSEMLPQQQHHRTHHPLDSQSASETESSEDSSEWESAVDSDNPMDDPRGVGYSRLLSDCELSVNLINNDQQHTELLIA